MIIDTKKYLYSIKDKNLNIISSKMYKDYRKNNWHSNYLHSHMLQEAIIGVIGSYKSYISLCNMYEKNKNSLRGQPRFPRFKKENIVQEIIFTKYAIRIEENKIKDKIVVVTGKVDTTKVGTYTITYKVTNSRGRTAIVQRFVKVIKETSNLNISLSQNNEEVSATTELNLEIIG